MLLFFHVLSVQFSHTFHSYFTFFSQLYSVLCGRGGETNHHHGNIKYRQLVKICQPAYIAAKRRDKPKIAQRIVRAVRLLGGRFLKKVPDQNYWTDVGNAKAREKTSQALREGAPELRGRESSSPTNTNTATEEQRPKQVKRKVEHNTGAVRHAVLLQSHAAPRHPYMEVAPPPSTGAAAVAYLHHMPQHPPPHNKKRRVSSMSTTATTEAPVPRTSTPTSFTATVSADDDEGTLGGSSATSSSSPATSPGSTSGSVRSGGGPRLKLLKRRLQENSEQATTSSA